MKKIFRVGKMVDGFAVENEPVKLISDVQISNGASKEICTSIICTSVI